MHESYYRFYRLKSENDETPAKWFVKELLALAKKLETAFKNVKPMQLKRRTSFPT